MGRNGGTSGRLAPRTRDLYLDIIERSSGTFDACPCANIRPETVRSWYAATRRELAKTARARSGSGETRLRQCYALLRASGDCCRRQVDRREPREIKRAGVAVSPERPYMSPEQFALIVGAHAEHVRPALMLAYGSHLRLGELIALQRRDLDLEAGTLRVERQTAKLADSLPRPTKTTRR